MPATLTYAQIYSALTQEHLLAVQSHWPVTGDQPDPVAEEIAAATARVDAYTAGWDPPAALLSAWARDIAVWHILKRLSLATEAHAQAKDTALEELKAVSEGKFPGIARTSSPLTGSVSHGSREKII
jgi:hypothetical protein